ncbi:uncharacterized protein O3C94_004914 [Discoglossus pictus]
MDRPVKHRPKSAPVITEAYFQNKREEESLLEKLNGMHYQHNAGLMRLRHAMGLVVSQRQKILTQRAITPQSKLEHVMEEIQTLKQVKHCTGNPKSYLPASTAEIQGAGTYSKWPPAPTSLRQASGSYDAFKSWGNKSLSSATPEKEIPFLSEPKITPSESTLKSLEKSEKPVTRKQRATSALERKPDSSMQSLTYRELGEIALLEKISVRETEKQKQKKLLEKQLLSKSFDTFLQQKIDNFLKKCE